MAEYIHTKRKHKPAQQRPQQQEHKGKGDKRENVGANSLFGIRAAAARGEFPFDVINGFKLQDDEYKTPPKEVRVARRHEFNKEVRPAFLKHIAQNFPDELRAIGVTDAELAIMRDGKGVPGYNVHHKKPLHGGGENTFKNLIFMPIGPHDELHHKVIDLQIQGKDTEKGLKIKLPWCDDMVWKRPAKSREKLNTVTAVLAQKRMER